MVATTSQLTITADAAHAAVGAAIQHGSKIIGAPVVAAVVDSSGVQVAMLRATGAPFHSTAIAHDKAMTAASFKVPSEAMFGFIAGNPSLVAGIPSRPGVAMFGGGLPIVIDGAVVGAIGVSGGSEAQDIECAKAGLAVIMTMSGK